LFEPFEISQWQDPSKYSKLLGFALVTAISTYTIRQIIPPIFPNYHAEKNWVIWKELVSIFILLLMITGGNILYGSVIFKWHLGFQTFFTFLGWVVGIALFPITFWVLSDYIYQLKKFSHPIVIQQVENTNASETLKLLAENGKDFLEIESTELRYIESSDNYSTVYFYKNGTLNKSLLRSSLTRLESQIADTKIVRTHRSYIVNLASVVKVSGNAQGFKLHFENMPVIIPVARKYSNVLAWLR
jgi:hypothetical protein